MQPADLDLICALFDIWRQPRNLPGSGTAMNDHTRTDRANPYSPLLCGLLLAAVLAATQLKVLAMF
jgi:hypothetical protein